MQSVLIGVHYPITSNSLPMCVFCPFPIGRIQKGSVLIGRSLAFPAAFVAAARERSKKIPNLLVSNPILWLKLSVYPRIRDV